MNKIITLGEVMLRLSPADNRRFAQANSFQIDFGGSEANVGAALAYWGVHVSHVTAFPDDELGKRAVSELRKNGLDTSLISFLPGRLGLYYLENGSLQRSSKIIYDRFGSSFAKYDGSDKDWEKVLEGVSWVHWSGISPAISQEAADLTFKILKVARSKNIEVSGDINYRSNLWQYGKMAHEVMPKLIELSSVLIAGTRDFNQCLNKDFNNFSEAKAYAFEKYPQLKFIAKTNRKTHSASHNSLDAELHSKEQVWNSKNYEVNPILDRVGTGDAFAAGLILGLRKNDPKWAVEFGMAAGVLKHAVHGDLLLSSIEEVQEVADGTSGKIKR